MIGIYKVAQLVQHNVFNGSSRRREQALIQRDYALFNVACAPARFHVPYAQLRPFNAVFLKRRIQFVQHFAEYCPALPVYEVIDQAAFSA